jgi:hypothetical protein
VSLDVDCAKVACMLAVCHWVGMSRGREEFSAQIRPVTEVPHAGDMNINLYSLQYLQVQTDLLYV